MSTGPAPTGKGDPRSHFAWIRTRMAAERTLMAWLRTAVSMIGFGFTIVQFFARMQDVAGVKEARHPEGPRYVGLALIAAGTVALLISAWQYHAMMKYLWSDTYRAIAPEKRGTTPTYAISLLMACIGLVAFVGILLRLV